MSLLLYHNSFRKRWVNKLLKIMSLKLGTVFISRGSSLQSKGIQIGNGTRINGKIVVKGEGRVAIGRYCAIGDGVRIISSNHELSSVSIQLALQRKMTGSVHLMTEKPDVLIGHDVWIGDAVILLPGVLVGNGAIIGAGSVVTRNVESFAVVVGNPAREIRKRFPGEVIRALAALEWWRLDEQNLKNIAFLFEHPLLEIETEKVLQMIERATEKLING